MLRNLVVPAVFIATTLLAGCQAFQNREMPAKTTEQQIISETDVSESGPDSEEIQSKKDKSATKPETPPAPKNIIAVHEEILQTPAHIDGRQVLGLYEKATFPDLNLSIEAKLDTGADISSADARNIELFERDRKKWVKFELHRTSKGIRPMELPVKEIIKIRRPGSDAIERPVVSMTISIGELTQPVDVSLTDRDNFDFPLLIGRNFVQDLAVVDVEKEHIADVKVIGNRSRRIEAPQGKKSYTRKIRQPVSVEGLTVVGALEHVYLSGTDLRLGARIDTGADTSSIDARDIELFTRNQSRWVRFKIPDTKGELVTMEQPVTRFVRIKRHGLENDRRPVITMDARIGSIKRPTQFTLRSREDYEYPILVGARFLESKAIVDVSREFVAR